MTITARCNCGQLKAFAEGAPARVSVCHCLNCKLRTGSAFSYNATYREEHVRTEGEAREYRRRTDSGNENAYSFCATCGSTVFYRVGIRPGMISIPAGAFMDSSYPPPTVELFLERASSWCPLQIG
jgi:hypothetical protein